MLTELKEEKRKVGAELGRIVRAKIPSLTAKSAFQCERMLRCHS